jgi:hypothetical protein
MDAFAPRGSSPDRTKPRFHMRAVEMPFKSREAGRPIFEDREFVEIIIPGQNKSTAIEPVNEQHKDRWPEAYAAFKRGQEMPTTGTPLEEWSVLSAATVANLKGLHMRTVEDLAAAPDAALQNIGQGGHDFRRRAQAFLEQAKGSAPLEKALQEIEHLKARNDVLEGQVKDLAALVQELQPEERSEGAPPPRRR